MDTKFRLLTLLITLGIVSSLLATCKKGESIQDTYNYRFKANWKVTPERDSITVGDTLKIISEFSNYPFDYISNTNVDYSGNSLIGTQLTLKVILGQNNASAAIDSFIFIPLIGKCETDIRTPGYIKQLYWREINNKYQLQFEIIALRKGIYSLVIVDGLAKNKNKSATLTLSNSNTKNNIYFLASYYGNISIPNADSIITYSFKVK